MFNFTLRFRRHRPRSVLGFTMDKNLVIIMIAAYFCGNYKSQINLPPPFQGRFAEAVEGYRHSAARALPYYTKVYGIIGSGMLYQLYILYI